MKNNSGEIPKMSVVVKQKTAQEVEIENLEKKINEEMAADEDLKRLKHVSVALAALMNDEQLHAEIAIGKHNRVRRLCGALFNSYIDIQAQITETVLAVKQEIQKKLFHEHKI